MFGIFVLRQEKTRFIQYMNILVKRTAQSYTITKKKVEITIYIDF